MNESPRRKRKDSWMLDLLRWNHSPFDATASVSAVILRVIHENCTEILLPPPFLDVHTHIYIMDISSWLASGMLCYVTLPESRLVPPRDTFTPLRFWRVGSLDAGGCESSGIHGCIYIYIYIPSRKLTYPTWGKGKSSSKVPFYRFLWGMLVPRRVYIYIWYVYLYGFDY